MNSSFSLTIPAPEAVIQLDERRSSFQTAAAARFGAYLTGAYWFTASTSFANPTVTIARALSNTFAGIRPVDAPGFIIAQFVALALVLPLLRRPIEARR
jgi:hypothetical protein